MNHIIICLSISILCVFDVSAKEILHPSFLFNSEQIDDIRQKSLSQEWLRNMREVIIKDAEHTLELNTNPYSLVDDSEHLYLGIAGRGVQVRVLNTAFAGYLTGDEKYFDKAKEILLAVVRQTEPTNNNQWERHHQVSDACQGIALGYDLLYPYLNESERKEVFDEIIKFGEYLYVSAGVWGTFEQGASSCNHNPVHHGALRLCALITGNHPEWLDRAIQRIEAFYTFCGDETGYITEGHHYLGYGFGGAFPFTLALKNITGYDLFRKYKNLISEAGEQILWNLLPDGGMTVLNDSYAGPIGEAAVYGAMLFNKPVQLWAWLKLTEDIPGQKDMNYYEKRGKFYLGLNYSNTSVNFYR